MKSVQLEVADVLRRYGSLDCQTQTASLSCAQRRVMNAIELCQSLARARWLDDRQADLLPVPYSHVVFTVPEEIAAIAYKNKAFVYDILFQATAETLRAIAAGPKHLGAELGFVAIVQICVRNFSIVPICTALFRRGRRSRAARARIDVCPVSCSSAERVEWVVYAKESFGEGTDRPGGARGPRKRKAMVTLASGAQTIGSGLSGKITE